MAKIDVNPFHTVPLDSDCVAFLPALVDGVPWDMDTTVRVEQLVSIDLPAFREACGLPPGAPLAATLEVRCDATYWTHTVVVPLDDSSNVPVTMRVNVPARTAAGLLRHQSAILLAEATPEHTARSATRAGSILCANAPSTIPLEGGAGQFPTDAVPFAATGREPGARWTIEYDYDSLDAPVLGCMRLLLNEDAPAVAALTGDDDPTDSNMALTGQLGTELRRFVISDVIRQMIDDDRFDDDQAWAEGSIGELAAHWLEQYAHATVRDLRAAAHSDRSRLERILQSTVLDTATPGPAR